MLGRMQYPVNIELKLDIIFSILSYIIYWHGAVRTETLLLYVLATLRTL